MPPPVIPAVPTPLPVTPTAPITTPIVNFVTTPVLSGINSSQAGTPFLNLGQLGGGNDANTLTRRDNSFAFNSSVATRGTRPAPVALASGGGNAGLALAIDPENRTLQSNTFILFDIPQGTFVHTNAEASVTLVAKLEDGNDLPGWLSFEATTGVFSGTPPEDYEGRLSIVVVARDSDGAEAEATFELIITEDAPDQVQGVEAEADGQVDAAEEAAPADAQPAGTDDGAPSSAGGATPVNDQAALLLRALPEGHAPLQAQLARAASGSVLGSALALLDELALNDA